MVQRVIGFVFIYIVSANAQIEQQETTIQASTRLNAISSKCARISEMNAEQLETAIQNKDIDKITACFFKCYLRQYGLIRQEADKETVNVPVTLVFVNMYIPDISFIDLLTVGAEVMICAEDFERNTLSDERPDCLKTKLLVNCLVRRKMLINAFWLAIKSWSTLPLFGRT